MSREEERARGQRLVFGTAGIRCCLRFYSCHYFRIHVTTSRVFLEDFVLVWLLRQFKSTSFLCFMRSIATSFLSSISVVDVCLGCVLDLYFLGKSCLSTEHIRMTLLC
ncbi:unnamed protein product [Ectocarpus fasciculatus]